MAATGTVALSNEAIAATLAGGGGAAVAAEGNVPAAVNAMQTAGPQLGAQAQSAIQKINNILTNNFKQGPKGDIAGAVSDMVGNRLQNLAVGYTTMFKI